MTFTPPPKFVTGRIVRDAAEPIADPTKPLAQAEARCAELLQLLKECRNWQAEGEDGEPLGPACWTPRYATFMAKLDEAIKGPR